MRDVVEMDPKGVQVKRLHKKTSKDDLRLTIRNGLVFLVLCFYYQWSCVFITMRRFFRHRRSGYNTPTIYRLRRATGQLLALISEHR
jgi:hypothetical protein